MTIIGSAYVDIRAITDHLEADIKKALASLPDKIDVKVDADTTAAEAQIDTLVEWGNIHEISVEVQADTALAEIQIADVAAEHHETTLNLGADTTAAQADIDAAIASAGSRSVDFHVDADMTAAEVLMAAFRAAESGNNIDVPVDVDTVVAATKFGALMATLDTIAAFNPVTIRVNTKHVDAAAESVKGTMSRLFTFMDGLSGAGALKDLTEKFIMFKINLGNEAPQIALTAMHIGSMATAAIWAAGSILSLGSSIASLAAVGYILPGILTGLAIGMGLTMIAMGAMKTEAPALAKEFGNLKTAIGANFWAQARDGLASLISPTNTLSKELKTTSTVLGTFWGTMFEGMSKGSFAQAMAEDFAHLKSSIEIATGGSATFLHIIETLGRVGSAYLPALAQNFVDISDRFDKFLSKAESDGSLHTWIQTALQGFKDLGGVVSGIYGLFSGLAKAATDAGGTTLGSLADGLKTLVGYVNEPATQTALVNLFTGANMAMHSAMEGLGEFLKGVGYLSPALKNVEQNVGIAIRNVLLFFGQILTNEHLFKGIQDLFVGIVNGLNKFAPAVGPIGDKLGIFLTVIGALADSLGGVFANAMVKILPMVSTLLSGIIPLIVPLGDITNHIVNNLAPAIGILVDTGFQPLINIVLVAISAINQILPILGPILTNVATTVGMEIATIAPIIATLIEHFTPLAVKIAEIAVVVGNQLTPVIHGIIDGFGKVVDAILPIVTGIIDAVTQFLSMDGVVTTLGVTIAGIVIAIGAYNTIVGISKGLQIAYAAASSLVSGVMAAWAARQAIMTGLIWAFNLALDANPIGLIVIAVAALIAGIVLLVTNWDTVTKAVSDFITSSGLGEWVNQTIGMFTDFGVRTAGMFVDFFNNTIGMFVDFGTNLWKSVTDVWDGVVRIINDVIANVISFVKEHWGLILSLFIGPLGLVIQWVVENWSQITKVFTDFVNNTIGMFTDFFNNVLNGFKGFARDPIGEVKKFVQIITDQITHFADGIVQTLNKFFTDVYNGFIKWRNDVVTGFLTWGVDVIKNVSKFVNDTAGMFGDFFKNTFGMFGDFFRNTDGMFTDFWAAVPKAIEHFRDSTIGMFRDWVGNSIGMFRDFFNNTFGMFHDFDSNTRGMFNDFFGGIGGMFNDFFDNLPKVVMRFVISTTGMFQDFDRNTNGMFADFFGGIVGMWNDFIGGIIGMVSDWVNGLTGMVMDYYNYTTGETHDFLTGMFGFFADFWSNTIGMFRDFFNNTVGMFRDFFNNAGQAVQDGINRVASFFNDLSGQITAAIGDPGTILQRAGSAIMDGFLGGLQAGWKGVTDFVGGIADWISKNKGPEAYDRALLVPHGGWIIGGLQKGIEGSMGGLQKTLAGVTNLVSDTMNAAVSVKVVGNLSGAGTGTNANVFTNASAPERDPFSAASSSSGGRTLITPTVNVYPSAPLNEAQVGQMAASELYWNFMNR